MSIVNRRNAVVGWLTLKVARGIARKKARKVGGKLAAWRKRSG
jgi:hypothetical protein